MKKLSTKILIILTLVVILLTIIKPTSYAEDSGGSGGSGAFIPRQQQEAVADYAQLFYKEGKEKNILLYSQNRFDRIRGYNFETSSNEYGQYDGVQSNGAPFTNMLVYDSASLIAFLYHQTLGMELSANKNSRDNVYICESFIEDARSTDAENHNFSFVGGSEKTYGSKELISMGDSGTLIPGDIIVYANQTHAMLYLGTNENIKFDELKISELRVQKMIRGFESTTHWQDTGENLPTDEFIDVEGLDNPHYFLHSANTEENVTISVLEALEYTEAVETNFYVLRPVATKANGITSQTKVIMEIAWPDDAYSTYTRLGKDPVTGEQNEYYYLTKKRDYIMYAI